MSRILIPKGFKLCSKCDRVFIASKKYFYADKSKKDGLYSSCKVCGRTVYPLFGKELKCPDAFA